MSNLPTVLPYKQLQDYALKAVSSQFYKSYNSPEKALMIMLQGHELGFGPMASLRLFNVIQGKPSLGSEAKLAKIYEKFPNAEIDFLEISNEKCVIEANRPGRKKIKFEFSMEDAERANLVKNDSGWKKYPRSMCKARAIAEMASTLYPEVMAGLSNGHTPTIEPFPEREVKPDTPEDPKEKLRKQIWEGMKENGWDANRGKTILKKEFGAAQLKDLDQEQLEQMLYIVENSGFTQELEPDQTEEDSIIDHEAFQKDVTPQKSKALEALERAKKGDPVVWTDPPAKDITEGHVDEVAEEKEIKDHAKYSGKPEWADYEIEIPGKFFGRKFSEQKITDLEKFAINLQKQCAIAGKMSDEIHTFINYVADRKERIERGYCE